LPSVVISLGLKKCYVSKRILVAWEDKTAEIEKRDWRKHSRRKMTFYKAAAIKPTTNVAICVTAPGSQE